MITSVKRPSPKPQALNSSASPLQPFGPSVFFFNVWPLQCTSPVIYLVSFTLHFSLLLSFPFHSLPHLLLPSSIFFAFPSFTFNSSLQTTLSFTSFSFPSFTSTVLKSSTPIPVPYNNLPLANKQRSDCRLPDVGGGTVFQGTAAFTRE